MFKPYNERTPDILFRSIHFTNELSIKEWEKHRGVVGWQIGPNDLIYSMQFKHPVYEDTSRKFLDYLRKVYDDAFFVSGKKNIGMGSLRTALMIKAKKKKEGDF